MTIEIASDSRIPGIDGQLDLFEISVERADEELQATGKAESCNGQWCICESYAGWPFSKVPAVRQAKQHFGIPEYGGRG